LPFLSFVKKDFSWTRRLKKDLSCADFDLFTCPSMYKEQGKTIVKTYDTLIIDDTLPLYLSDIRSKPYRLKVEGYSQPKNNKPATVIFKDIETGQYDECTVNNKSKSLRIQVLKFELQDYEKDGVYYEIPMVTIYDDVLNKKIILTNEQKFLEDEYLVIIKDFSGNEYTFYAIGDSVQIGEAMCTLRSFNKKEGTAKLSLKDANGHEFNKTVHLIR